MPTKQDAVRAKRPILNSWRSGHRLASVLVGLALLVGLVAATSAFASEGEQSETVPPPQATQSQTREALESPSAGRLLESQPDAEAAAELPHRDLGRGEALALAEAVFGAELEGPPSVFSELEPSRFLSDYAAVVPADSLPGAAQEEGGAVAGQDESVVIESSLPLRTEGAGGAKEPVDLSLQMAEGELQPANPLSELGIPGELGEGISLPEVGVGVELAEAPAGRAPSNVEGKFGFYPNVAEDTDFLVSPLPTGVETLTNIRSADAPKTQAFNLSLPAGSELKANAGGGAEVVQGGRVLVTVPPPTAMDAQGQEVPVDLKVSGDSIELTLSPAEDTAYPVLLDPAFLNEEFGWWLKHDSLNGWNGGTSAPSYQPVPYAFFWGGNYPGPDLTSGFPGSAPYGTAATWVHTVPRYNQDIATFGTPPSSYIRELFAEGVMFLTHGDGRAYPVLILGLVDPKNGWAVYGTHYGTQGDMNSLTNHFEFWNEHEMTGTKMVEMALATYEAEASAKLRDTYIGNAMVVLADNEAPRVTTLEPPAHWVNTTALPIPYGFEDTGLGVRAAMITGPGESSAHPGWGAGFGCVGTNVNPCPRSVASTEAGSPALTYNPSELPTGIDYLTVTAGDATWAASNEVAQTVKVRVDHAPPTLAISGTLTEQATLGTAKPQYTLRYSATDGSQLPPTFISSVGSEGTAAGQFKHPADVAFDSNQNVWVTDQGNNRIEKESEKGEFSSYGTLGSGAGQLNRPTGIAVDSSNNVWVADTGNNRVEEFNAKGEYVRAFGTLGSGNGKLSAPQGIAVDPAGNIWVADTANNRIEEFSGSGEFKGAFGSKGSAAGQLSEPTALDIGPGGNVWVADTANNRIEEFSETGEYIAAYGALGSANGQFNRPDAIDVDTWGNVWVGDQGNARVEQFSERGEYLGKFGSAGTGAGQFSFSAPIGLTTNNAGKLWVTDSADNRVENWNAPQGTQSGIRSVTVKVDGKVVAEPKLDCETGGCPLAGQWNLQSGEYSAGSHVVQVLATDGVGLTSAKELSITLNPPPPTLAVSGTLTEQATLGLTRPRYTLALTGAAEEGVGAPPASAPSYRSAFGSLGSGNGQLSSPGGLAVDAAGNVWVADKNNNRIEEFSAHGTYLASIGSSGSENGQLSGPTAVAIDSNGNLLVADTGNARIEKFTPSGEYVTKFGTAGTGIGQFAAPGPEGVAVDAKGNIWVSDTYGSRVEEFNAKGAFIRVVGSRGGGVGQLSEPSGIAVAANGNAWVTDWANQRIEVYNEAGEYVRQFGSEGSGERQFKHPNAIAIDPSGNVWVADQNNERVQEFNQSGRYLGQLGSAGSGAGQFSFVSPMGIAADPQGNLWVSDTANNRVERWREATRSVAKAEVTLDDKAVESNEVSCTTETCPVTLEWALESSAYAAGPHVVVVKITDGFGRTTSKTLNIEIRPDGTKPTLEVGGELANAPEGWVQQEGYGFHAIATDPGGYGVTSLVFKIDGSAVASTSQPCPSGGCEALLASTINMAPYSGGAHPAEVIATDGAGNTTVHRWTINVDPEGHISTQEATDTIEALEETSEANLVGESEEEAGVEGSAPGLGIHASAGQFEATGTEVPLVIDPEPQGGFVTAVPEGSVFEKCTTDSEAESAEGESLQEAEASSEAGCELGIFEETEQQPVLVTVTPVDLKEGGGSGNLVDEAAVVAPNTKESVDTVLRPLWDGGMVFAAIRDSSAPEEYSWRVSLSHDQELRLIDEKDAEVYYNNGLPALSISAEPAHDAVGTEVPTKLSVEQGEIVTLTVNYKNGHEGQPYVYPIVGGTGWQGGFQTTEVELAEPLPEEEEWEEEGAVREEEQQVVMTQVAWGPPIDEPTEFPSNPTYAERYNYHTKARAYRFNKCVSSKGGVEIPAGGHLRIEPNGSSPQCHNQTSQGSEPEFKIEWAVAEWGKFWYQYGHKVWVKRKAECKPWGPKKPDQENCHYDTWESSQRINVLADYHFADGTLSGSPLPGCGILNGVLPIRPQPSENGEPVLFKTVHWFPWLIRHEATCQFN